MTLDLDHLSKLAEAAVRKKGYGDIPSYHSALALMRHELEPVVVQELIRLARLGMEKETAPPK